VTHLSPIALRHRRRNWAAFFGDYVLFGIGLTFASVTTTLPAFAAALTDNKVLIGAVTAIWTGGWLLPQLFAARYLSDQPRKYPIMFWGQIMGRPILGVFAIWLFFAGAVQPGLTLALFLIAMLIFSTTDAVVALAWFDLLGKAMAPETRGRMFGVGQIVMGLGALGAGALVQYLLGPRGPGFPVNYAIVLGLGAFMFLASQVACIFIVEPPESVPAQRPTLREYLPQLFGLLRTDAAFGRIAMVRLLAGLSSLASAFYVLHATTVLQLPAGAIGLFAGAATIGGALAGIALGPVADRFGSHRVVQISSWSQVLTPVLALAFHYRLAGAAGPALYPVLYVLLGLFEGSMVLGFMNYVLEIAPQGQRPSYIGLINTLTGVLIFVPLIGGWILEHTSYPVLFALAAAGTLVSALLAMRLDAPPRAAQPLALPADSGHHILPGA
jgi:MFS family permease